MELTEIKKYYEENEDFRCYVDKCREADGRTVDEELKLKTVQQTALDYQGKLKGWTE